MAYKFFKYHIPDFQILCTLTPLNMGFRKWSDLIFIFDYYNFIGVIAKLHHLQFSGNVQALWLSLNLNLVHVYQVHCVHGDQGK